MRRPNPEVLKGSIGSILGGTRMQFVSGGLDGKIDANLERSLRISQPTCLATPGGLFCPVVDNFTQIVLDGRLSFPTFGTQTFTFTGHSILTTAGVVAPPQRFGYLGGAGTLATVDLLALGGDHLLFVAGDVGESAAHGSTIAMTVTLRLDLQLDFACPQRKKGNDGPPSLV